MIYKKSEQIGFIFFPAKYSDDWDKIDKNAYMFIGFSDFKYTLLEHVESAYPLIEPETNQVNESFEVCYTNCINKEAWKKIISRIQKIESSDEALKEFLNNFCSWILENLKSADEIVVRGTI